MGSGEFIPSKYQERIFDFVRNGQGNAVIEAVAGAGKSTTALKCIELMGEDDKILLTAFNTDIVEELRKKVSDIGRGYNIDCKTMHSLGYTMLMRSFPGQIDQKPNDFKYIGYIYNNIGKLSKGECFKLKGKDRAKYIDNIRKFVDFGRFYMCDTVDDMQFVEDRYRIPVYSNEKEAAVKVLEWGKCNIGTIDFTDMVWLPNVLDCKPSRIYDWIICDECQDTMTAERMLMLRCTKMSTRMLFFGESIQCQPEGTRVLMGDGSEKNIEDIKTGDEVVGYNIKKGTYSGYRTNIDNNRYPVTEIESHVDNKFVRVRLKNGMTSTYTPEHICLTKFNFSGMDKAWGICVMENSRGMFFVGKALLYSNRIHHGLLKNMRKEHCVRGWVLEVVSDETTATIESIRVSHKYNIPPVPSVLFKENTEEMIRNRLSTLYEQMGGVKISENTLKCLAAFNRLPQYPISDADNEIPHARTLLHPMRACNLMPNIMEMSYFDLGSKSKKVRDSYRYTASKISSIEYDNTERMVYSLNVAKCHTYVADGIATHNCIYSFMGSDFRSFDELKKLPNTISLPLSISYRCSKKVVEYSKKFNGQIEAREGAPDGNVIKEASVDDIRDGDMVLCRMNAPLLQMYCDLTNAGKTAYIRGKDIGTNLTRIISKTEEKLLNKDLKEKGVFSHLYNKLLDEIDTVMNGYRITFEMAMDDIEVSQQFDTIQALDVISRGMNTAEELTDKVNSLFSNDAKKGISLSTIHKAKGLEADNVFICCPSLMPAKSAKEDWEMQQERNLEYVAYTRAKENLYFLSEEGFSQYSSNSQQKASEIRAKMHDIFILYGGDDRCKLRDNILKVDASRIEKIEEDKNPKNTINLGSHGSMVKANQLISTVKKRRKKR